MPEGRPVAARRCWSTHTPQVSSSPRSSDHNLFGDQAIVIFHVLCVLSILFSTTWPNISSFTEKIEDGRVQPSAARLARNSGNRCFAVHERFLNEYSGRSPKDVGRILAEARAGLPVESLPEVVERDVEFTCIGAHGRTQAPVILVRAEAKVDGVAPPDGRPVRRFRLSRKFMGNGWMIVGESDSYSYYRELVHSLPRVQGTTTACLSGNLVYANLHIVHSTKKRGPDSASLFAPGRGSCAAIVWSPQSSRRGHFACPPIQSSSLSRPARL